MCARQRPVRLPALHPPGRRHVTRGMAGAFPPNRLFTSRPTETLKPARGRKRLFTAVGGTIDNGFHHRGRGTVFLRGSGVTPPAFRERT